MKYRYMTFFLECLPDFFGGDELPGGSDRQLSDNTAELCIIMRPLKFLEYFYRFRLRPYDLTGEVRIQMAQRQIDQGGYAVRNFAKRRKIQSKASELVNKQ